MENDEDVFRVGKLAKFTINLDDDTFSASVTSPSNEQIECTAEETDNGNCLVRFVPTEIGDYLIKVYKGTSIPISKFTYTVVDKDKNPNTFTNESGIYRGAAGKYCQNQVFRVGEAARFTIKLEDYEHKILPRVISPSNALVFCEMEEIDDASFKINFLPEQCGDYSIKVYRGSNFISEIRIKVVDFKNDTNNVYRLECDSHPDRIFKVGELARFTVNMEESKSNVSATVTAPSNKHVDCAVEEIDEANCKVRFVPKELGDYVVTIFKNNKSISQFTIKVGDSRSYNQSIVGTHYQGGRIFTVGEAVSFTVNVEENKTKKTFTASVTSPSNRQVPCSLMDLPNGGCKVKFTPNESGDYVIKIFQDDHDVPVQEVVYKYAKTRNTGAFEINVNLNLH